MNDPVSSSRMNCFNQCHKGKKLCCFGDPCEIVFAFRNRIRSDSIPKLKEMRNLRRGGGPHREPSGLIQLAASRPPGLTVQMADSLAPSNPDVVLPLTGFAPGGVGWTPASCRKLPEPAII